MAQSFTLEYWRDEDWYVGRLREVPGGFSQGTTLAELTGTRWGVLWGRAPGGTARGPGAVGESDGEGVWVPALRPAAPASAAVRRAQRSGHWGAAAPEPPPAARLTHDRLAL